MQQQRKGPDLRRLTTGPAVKDLVGRMLLGLVIVEGTGRPFRHA